MQIIFCISLSLEIYTYALVSNHSIFRLDTHVP